ncbi:uncharacterized protein LOC110710797 [Chenopodium quinoa]|uniref:uncharacterized protein LOC110710797 n=1 Tax=Chenopodium quinoa TaxID=63459 RepID=UPI000B79465D|nr:uncharacterized protein LOC110710797 [Chenopodium quinoa]
MNANVTAEYLAEKYVEEWRSNPNWKINNFRDKYSRVWDYGKAVQKYSPGTVVNVVVDQLDRPEPPLFLRMYVCLSPLVRGFLKGCRPLIGVDGCHLKGSYPGQILVVVGKDGNNSIYPFAWATVEVENKETWSWFLECLKQSLDDLEMGGGFTYMSDRQKGLLEAFEEVVPFAEKRFCADFEIAMESIRFLSEDAYEYLDNIPAQHWSRHAFSTNCKSNMLLNNMCETFNACIREARDKPILTQIPKHWEKIQLREPLPPPVRVMPGRPKSKKRKKERGKGVAEAEGTSQKRQKRCQKCAQFGHYAKTFSNVPAEVKQSSSHLNTKGKAIVNTAWVVKQRRTKATRALNKTTPGATTGPNRIVNKKFPQEEAKKKAAAAAAKTSSKAVASQGAEATSKGGLEPSEGTGRASQGAEASSEGPNTRSRKYAGAEPYLCSQASTTTTAKNTTATRASKKKI